MLKKKIWANFQRIIELFTQKIVNKPQKYGFGIRDPGFEIRDPEKTYSGSRIQGSKRHQIPDPDPQHCIFLKASYRQDRALKNELSILSSVANPYSLPVNMCTHANPIPQF
jgi:hypothetical protein